MGRIARFGPFCFWLMRRRRPAPLNAVMHRNTPAIASQSKTLPGINASIARFLHECAAGLLVPALDPVGRYVSKWTAYCHRGVTRWVGL